MESTGCYLDLHTEGERNPESKFVTGSTVDDFVLGKLHDAKSKSPGLALNTLALCEIVYGNSSSMPPPQRPAPAAAPTAAAPQPRAGTRRRRGGPVAGFHAVPDHGDDHNDDTVSVQQQQREDGTADDDLKELLALEVADERTDSNDMRGFLTERFGNRAANVLSVLKLWEAYGRLYNAWCDLWPVDTPAYRAERAMKFIRAGTRRSFIPCMLNNLRAFSRHSH
eukprot:4259937-Pleurochrysis_carterae.AAC.1